jgi:pimeloyl-ACP methyl ester carboxylesterase
MSDPVPRAVANLRGLSRLAVAGVLGVTDVVDRMHHEIARSTRLVRATRDGRAVDLDDPVAMHALASSGRRPIVLVHGLCMHEGQWRRRGHDHGRALSRDLGATALHLRYNTGRHVSDNGREFAELLERLTARWPGGLDELVIVGHSMGGLVARSACHHAQQAGHRWLPRLRALACLGTPQHGTVLERSGHVATTLLGFSRHAAPLAQLAQARSAGITDLRFGNVQAEDWSGRDRHAQARDDRRPTPLPPGVDVYLLAATRASRRAPLHDRLVGDGLVPLPSALGEHPDPALALHVPEARRCVVPAAGHWDLLHRPEAYAQLRGWLRSPPRGRTR